MNVVDSSGWLEYFAASTNANFFAPVIEKTDELIVPTIVIYEVSKRLQQSHNEGEDSLSYIASMMQGLVVELDTMIALDAAQLSLKHKTPMADSIILATARAYNATLWTQDADLEGLDGVEYIEKK